MNLTLDLDDVDVLVITPDGELDLVSAPLLGSIVESAVDCGVRRVDLSRVTFIDARGVSALVRCRRRADDDRFSVSSASPQVWRLFELTGCREANPRNTAVDRVRELQRRRRRRRRLIDTRLGDQLCQQSSSSSAP